MLAGRFTDLSYAYPKILLELTLGLAQLYLMRGALQFGSMSIFNEQPASICKHMQTNPNIKCCNYYKLHILFGEKSCSVLMFAKTGASLDGLDRSTSARCLELLGSLASHVQLYA